MSCEVTIPALETANGVFRTAYASARTRSQLEAPLLVVLAKELVLHTADTRRVFAFTCPSFDTAKVVAHVAVAVYSATGATEASGMPVETVLCLDSIRSHIEMALTALEAEQPEGDDLTRELVAVLQSSLEFARRASAERRVPAIGRQEFAAACGPRILRATELATAGQVRALHDAFEQALAAITPEEQKAIQVVVVGDHQARARSLGMQYFQCRFGEAEGADDRVTYGENVADEAEAIALVGTRRLDFEIALAFFGDEKRLQRDVLGDAAKHCLDQLQLEKIHGAGV